MDRDALERLAPRAVARAERGQVLDLEEIAALAAARGPVLQRLLDVATSLRDLGLSEAGRPATVTYSRKVFIPLTRLCRDRCHYCTFATAPARLPAPYLSADEVLQIARDGAAMGCKEALFTLGDRPEDRWPQARAWLDERGYDDTLSYVRAMAILVLEETGLLPHLNPGVMTWHDLQRLRPVAPSMGLMVETTATRLWSEPGGPHFGSPDKEPAVRLRVLEDAGRHAIPFTTGILVGIGEDERDRAESILAIRDAHRRHGHVQEVIVQNFRAKPDTAMRGVDDLELEPYLAAIATARVVLGPRMRIQAPPNLTDARELALLLRAGVDDWGGVSPLTPDHVNPERPWPHLDDLARLTAESGLTLAERLTAHPEYVRAADRWIDPRLHDHVVALADAGGLAVAGLSPVGRPWQDADPSGSAYAEFAARSAGGRVDLHRDVDSAEFTRTARSDTDIYGDWSELSPADRWGSSPLVSVRGDGDHRELSAALRLAAEDPAALADPRHEALAVALMSCDGAALAELAQIADEARAAAVGDVVTYVVNRNINFTNVCYTGCRFCAFAMRETDADAFTLSLDDVEERVAEAWRAGATEICMQGGIHPGLPGTAYFDLARAVKRAAPDIHLHAFSPMEITNGAARSGMTVRAWLEAAREAGVDSIPGTAAEILDDDVRWILTKGKLPTSTWLEVVATAHEVGLPSTSTMMYGHVDAPRHWVAHLRVLRTLQERTGGITEFVPLPFIHQQAPAYLAGIARPGPSLRDNVAVHAMARLMLDGAVRHIQCSWVKLGDDGCRAMLASGADDIGGTLMEETISRMAGSQHGSARRETELIELIASANRQPRQRSTLYSDVPERAADRTGSAHPA